MSTSKLDNSIINGINQSLINMPAITASNARISALDLQQLSISSLEAQESLNTTMLNMRHKIAAVEKFKEQYTKIRTDNVALSHQAAIELVKMINREANTITYEDTQ